MLDFDKMLDFEQTCQYPYAHMLTTYAERTGLMAIDKEYQKSNVIENRVNKIVAVGVSIALFFALVLSKSVILPVVVFVCVTMALYNISRNNLNSYERWVRTLDTGQLLDLISLCQKTSVETVDNIELWQGMAHVGTYVVDEYNRRHPLFPLDRNIITRTLSPSKQN